MFLERLLPNSRRYRKGPASTIPFFLLFRSQQFLLKRCRFRDISFFLKTGIPSSTWKHKQATGETHRKRTAGSLYIHPEAWIEKGAFRQNRPATRNTLRVSSLLWQCNSSSTKTAASAAVLTKYRDTGVKYLWMHSHIFLGCKGWWGLHKTLFPSSAITASGYPQKSLQIPPEEIVRFCPGHFS